MGGASGIWRRREAWRIVGPILAVGVTATGAHAQCQYDVTIIQAPVCPAPLAEPPATFATALNDFGEVVGYHRQCDELTLEEAFVWSPATGMVTLERPAGVTTAKAFDINDAGQIVGRMGVEGSGSRGFVLEASQWIEIVPPGAGLFSDAVANNNAGSVVGYRNNDDNTQQIAYLWQDGMFIDIPPLARPGFGNSSFALDVSDAGALVGYMRWAPDFNDHAFVWDDGVMIDLGVIPGGFTGRAVATNALGHFVITGRLSGVVTRSFLWQNTEMTDLGVLPGFDRCFASDVNDANQVIGVCDQSANPNNDVPFIWQNGIMTELSMLIADDGGLQLLRNVSSINNSGQITGWGIGPDGHVVAALLTPVNSSPADVNNDCAVNVVDLIELLLCFGEPAGPPCHLADVNNDGVVNVLDLIILLLNFGR